MKHLYPIAFSLMLLAACGGQQHKAATADAVTTREQLTFPFGEPLPAPPFTGEAYIHRMITPDSIFNFPTTNNITFAPGAHSSWHRHGGMVVMVTGGVGLYQEEGRPAQVLHKGDVLQIPAGVRHWHGATKDNWFSQIVIYDAAWQPTGDYPDEDNTVSDEYYNSLPVEYGQPGDPEGPMFPVQQSSPLSSPNFTGPVYLSSTLEDSNVAGAASMHYVLFPEGVYNAWHSHPGGQILIVTDGVGYHQIEGQPVEVLHPGDVVRCPPDVMHWHGATAQGRFAHLAVGTNPDKPTVVWTEDFVSKEEYDRLPR